MLSVKTLILAVYILGYAPRDKHGGLIFLNLNVKWLTLIFMLILNKKLNSRSCSKDNTTC